MFRSTDSRQNWQRINNGLLALYESGLAINTNSYILVGTDFVGDPVASTTLVIVQTV
jgi:hypothetical protein